MIHPYLANLCYHPSRQACPKTVQEKMLYQPFCNDKVAFFFAQSLPSPLNLQGIGQINTEIIPTKKAIPKGM